MLTFVCPFCEALLRVEESMLGMRGRCNKCGGNIALIGNPATQEPQVASVTAELANGRAPRPATARQLALLAQFGAPEAQTAGMNIIEAARLIDRLTEQRRQSEPPTDKQLKHLRHLGAAPQQIARLLSKADASQLIEDMHLSPTRMQLEELKEAGATGAQIAALKSKGAADALLAELRKRTAADVGRI